MDHILQALLISGSDASLSLLHVQAGFARLLRQCYVDSAVLHPLSSNGALDSKSNTVSVGEGKDERSWMEVFEEECYSKVLCQSSQLSDGLFEVADDMTETEHQAAVRYVPRYEIRNTRLRMYNLSWILFLGRFAGPAIPTLIRVFHRSSWAWMPFGR